MRGDCGSHRAGDRVDTQPVEVAAGIPVDRSVLLFEDAGEAVEDDPPRSEFSPRTAQLRIASGHYVARREAPLDAKLAALDAAQWLAVGEPLVRL